jgi:hypothetical protein
MDNRVVVGGAIAVALVLVLLAVLSTGEEASPPEAAAEPPGAPGPLADQASAANAVKAAAAAAIVSMASRKPEGGVDWPTLDRKIDAVQGKAWDTLKKKGWREVRDDLLADLRAVRALPLEERAARRESEVALLAQLGRAAENGNEPIAPCYGDVGDQKQVNRAWYEAATLVVAHGDGLLEVLGDNEQQSIAQYVAMIREGKLPKEPPEAL